jgi:hypothetical protein
MDCKESLDVSGTDKEEKPATGKKTAAKLHQQGDIPANTYVFDADTFEQNGTKR